MERQSFNAKVIHMLEREAIEMPEKKIGVPNEG